MDKKKKKLKGDVYEDPLKPSAFEIEVANYLYNNLPSLDGKLSGCRVSIFYPADAVELLIKSQWSKFKLKNKPNESAHFSSEESAVRFMTKMLEKNMISRAIKAKKKVVNKRKEQEKWKVKTTKATVSKTSKSEKSQNEAGEQHDSETDKVESKSSPTESSSSPAEKSGETKSKKSASAGDSFLSLPFFSTTAPKPIRLEYTEAQLFTLDDPDSVYVWIHEPPPSLKTWLLGAGLILAIILCCFFPIWPWQLRQCAYYGMVLVLLLLCLLFVTALIRLALYVCVFLLSLGRRQFWLFPNFFADCGFFESFRPAYSFEKTAAAASASPTKSSKKEGKRTSKKAAVVESPPPPASGEEQPVAIAAEGDSEKVPPHGKQD